MSLRLLKLKEQLKNDLVLPSRTKKHIGVPTGINSLDQYLFSNGLPKGTLSLIYGRQGSGATSFLLNSISPVLKQEKWVAWMGETNHSLSPLYFRQNRISTSKLLYVETPNDSKKIFWALSELISLSLFEIICCDVNALLLKSHQLLALKKMARQFQVAVVFSHRQKRPSSTAAYSLVLNLTPRSLIIERAQQRPTPHSMERTTFYENIMPQLKQLRESIHRRKLS